MSDPTQIAETTPLDEVARRLAVQHLQTTEPGLQPHLLLRLNQYDIALQRIYQEWVETSDQEQLLPSAADWLLDNYYIVRQVIQQLKEDLPPAYYRELPVLVGPERNGTDTQIGSQPHLPRVYTLACTLVEQVPLQPSMSRGYPVSQSLPNGVAIDDGRTLGDSKYAALHLARATRPSGSPPHPSQGSFGGSPPGCAAIAGSSTTQVEDGQPVATEKADDDQIVADAFVGLRLVNSTDWQHFFEVVSLVHQILLQDPAEIYAGMTDDTRNRYRQQVEHLARYSRHSEIEVATQAVALALEAKDSAATATSSVELETTDTGVNRARTSHVGYYLRDKGRRRLEAELAYAPPPTWRLRRWVAEHPTPYYFSSIGLLTVIVLSALIVGTIRAGGTAWQIALVALLGIVPALTVAVSIVHWLLTLLLPPRILPKLALRDGVPLTARTMVVIPAQLNRLDDVDDLFQQLELHYLRNPDPNGHVTFALLTDFGDASVATLPDDDLLLARAQATVARLNEKYSGRPFYFFHRKRLWNPSQGVWMGWERKRGKLEEFNHLLRKPVPVEDIHTSGDASPSSFVIAEGDLSILPQVRYVITLDADTVLPRDAARRLVATITHPLNRADV